MAGELARIGDELRRGYDGDCWHGPPLLEVLKGISAQQAAARNPHLTHSIWELVNHLIVWLEIVTLRTTESRPIADAGLEDFASARQVNEAAWQKTLQELASKHCKLLDVIAGLEEKRLDDLVPGKNYPLSVMLHGTSQHYAYHAGQIALLKKLAGAASAPHDAGRSEAAGQ
jgi:uncharacterized damage-inducible protein DinB